MVRTVVDVTPASLFFHPELPYHINRVSESFHLHLHRHEFAEISLVMEGKGTHYIGNCSIDVSPGDLFLLPIGTEHVFRPRSIKGAEPLVISNFIFLPELAAAALAGFPGIQRLERASRGLNMLPSDCEPNWAKLKDTRGAYRGLFEMCYELQHRQDEYAEPMLHALFVQLLAEIDRGLVEAERSDGEPEFLATAQHGENKLEKLLKRLKQDPAEAAHAEKLASEIGWSVRHFHRKFKEATGKTLGNYVQDSRIELACRLLRNGDSVQLTAEKCGYSDRGFFTRIFTRHMGLTPREYRKRGAFVSTPASTPLY
ncbi:AraC-type DNA-binding protein [Paenibacillaceae bacterium GAS479]|nr:AraC-type DNA-binding protein [Paenibacillaceae bacterium GAS479]